MFSSTNYEKAIVQIFIPGFLSGILFRGRKFIVMLIFYCFQTRFLGAQCLRRSTPVPPCERKPDTLLLMLHFCSIIYVRFKLKLHVLSVNPIKVNSSYFLNKSLEFCVRYMIYNFQYRLLFPILHFYPNVNSFG